MSQVFQLATINSGSTGAQLKAAGSALYAAENSQPEGTKMELVLTLTYPSNVVSAFSSVSAANARTAALLNTACLDAHITPWAGATNIATPMGTNQIALQWTKGSAWILVVIGIIAGLALFLTFVPGAGWILTIAGALGAGIALYEWISGWRFEHGMFVNVNTNQSVTPEQFFSKTLPQDLGNALQGAFNNLPMVLGGAVVLFFGGMWLLDKGRSTTVQVFDPHGYRAKERHTARQARIVANERDRIDRRRKNRKK